MAKILFVHHSPSSNTRTLSDTAIAAVRKVPDVTLISCDSLTATVDDVLACDGLLLGTTENFGSIAGLTKDFFERIYYPCEHQTEGLPFAAYVRAGIDGAGSVAAISRMTSGLRWRAIQETCVLQGSYHADFEEKVADLAQTLAAGVDAGIF
ncbi:MAG: flavodoxin family protein [Woeseiaceae bacterium]